MPFGLTDKLVNITNTNEGTRNPLIDSRFIELKGSASGIIDHNNLLESDVFLIQRDDPATGDNTYHTPLSSIAYFV